MTDGDVDFDPEELAMLRQLFRSEARDALESVTELVLAAGSAPPSREALTEMMRATHTMKGAAGTVGLPVMVDLAHRLEDAFAGFSGASFEMQSDSFALFVGERGKERTSFRQFAGAV